jgi:hypothetical protein
MEKRISITPRKGLLTAVRPEWQRKFAEEAAEVIISEGRYSEMMTRISGITLADLSGEPNAVTQEKTTRQRKTKAAVTVTLPSIVPVPVPEIEHETETEPVSVTVVVPSEKTEVSGKGQLGLNF